MKICQWHTVEDSMIFLIKMELPMIGNMWFSFEDFEFGEAMDEVAEIVADLAGIYSIAFPKVEIEEAELETIQLDATVKLAKAKISLLALEKCRPLPGVKWADTGYNWRFSMGGLVLTYEDAQQFIELFKAMDDLDEETKALMEQSGL